MMLLMAAAARRYTGIIPPAEWSITAGDASAVINSYPEPPTTPAWAITPGDGSAVITSYPGA